MRIIKSKVPHFSSNLGEEESHVTESYERKVHGVPELGQQREYSYNTYTERRSYGRDENGELIVRIEEDPKEPVRPVSPVRPVTPVEPIESLDSTISLKNNNRRRYLNNNHRRSKTPNGYRPVTPVQPFDTLPLSIPRIEIDKVSNNAFSPQSHQNTTTFYEHSPRSDDSLGYISQSTYSGDGGVDINGRPISAISMANSTIPLKKITKESRWVSVHDGKPVTPYVKTVTYVPKYSDQEYIVTRHNDRNYYNDYRFSTQPKQVTYEDKKYSSRSINAAGLNKTGLCDPCSVFIENPLYSGRI